MKASKLRRVKSCPCCGNKNLTIDRMSATSYGVICISYNHKTGNFDIGCGLKVERSLPSYSEKSEKSLVSTAVSQAIKAWNKRVK